MQRAILGKPTHILGQAFSLLRPLTQSPDSLINIAASPPHSHLPGSGPGLPTGSAHRSVPSTALGPGAQGAPQRRRGHPRPAASGNFRRARARPAGSGPGGEGTARPPLSPASPSPGGAAAHGTCAVRHVPHGGRHRDGGRGGCGGDGRRCARAGPGRAARGRGALRRRSRNGGGGGTEWPRPELSPRKRVRAAPGGAATRRAEGPAGIGALSQWSYPSARSAAPKATRLRMRLHLPVPPHVAPRNRRSPGQRSAELSHGTEELR